MFPHETYRRASVKQKPTIGTVWDLVAIAATLVVAVYIFSDIAGFQNRAGMLNKMDVIMGAIFIVLVLEAARRTVGKVMVILCLFFLAHTAFSHYFPGFLNGPPSSLKSIVNWIFASTEGIFSTPVGVMASYIFLFVLFGSLMIHTGAGELFIDFALVATGKMQGGARQGRRGLLRHHGYRQRQRRGQCGDHRHLYHPPDEEGGFSPCLRRCR